MLICIFFRKDDDLRSVWTPTKPHWISIREALHSNRSLLESASPPEWLRREIFMLEYLQRANL